MVAAKEEGHPRAKRRRSRGAGGPRRPRTWRCPRERRRRWHHQSPRCRKR
jgi:hypothetical protein